MIVYEYPKCSTCKKALRYLDEHNQKYEKINIVETPPTAKELQQWIVDNQLPLRKVFNTSGQRYRSLNLKDKIDQLTIEEACEKYLSQDGMLIKRPIIVTEHKVLFGFKETEVDELFE